MCIVRSASRGLLALLVFWLLGSGVSTQSATRIDLDTSPPHVFGDDPYAAPLFDPELLGLTEGSNGYERAEALSTAAGETLADFPPAGEFFAAAWGNPGYALLGSSMEPASLPAGDSSYGMAVRFVAEASGARSTYTGRGTAVVSAETLELDVGGATLEAAAAATHSPLVLDLDHDGVLGASGGHWKRHPGRLTGPYVAFDINGDGAAEVTEWIEPGDGLLCRTAMPTNGHDLFGTAGGWSDGFACLAGVMDGNGDGVVDGSERDGLFVWEDLDGDGSADGGEVRSLDAAGITSLGTTHEGFVGYFTDADGTNTMWDWWPNTSAAFIRAPEGTAAPSRIPGAAVSLQQVLALPVPAPGPALAAPAHFSSGEMTAAGLVLGEYHLIAVAARGKTIVGSQPAGNPAGVDVWQIDFDAGGTAGVRPPLRLRFPRLFQAVTDTAGRRLLAIGLGGGGLAVADLKTGVVYPPGGIRLAAHGLRASGSAGFSNGRFWFAAWSMDSEGRRGAEQFWTFAGQDLVAGLNLDALRQSLGEFHAYTPTGPDSGFFVTPNPPGVRETLWRVVRGDAPLAIAHAEAFAPPAAVAGAIAFAGRSGDQYTLSLWRQGLGPRMIATGSGPFLFPHITSDGGAVLVAGVPNEHGIIAYRAFSTGAGGSLSPLFNAPAGQLRACRGAMVYHGSTGLDVYPFADAPGPRLAIRRAAAGGGSDLILSWPASQDFWRAQTGNALGDSPGSWTMLPTNTRVFSGMDVQTPVGKEPGGRAFFRLLLPGSGFAP